MREKPSHRHLHTQSLLLSPMTSWPASLKITFLSLIIYCSNSVLQTLSGIDFSNTCLFHRLQVTSMLVPHDGWQGIPYSNCTQTWWLLEVSHHYVQFLLNHFIYIACTCCSECSKLSPSHKQFPTIYSHLSTYLKPSAKVLKFWPTFTMIKITDWIYISKWKRKVT